MVLATSKRQAKGRACDCHGAGGGAAAALIGEEPPWEPPAAYPHHVLFVWLTDGSRPSSSLSQSHYDHYDFDVITAQATLQAREG